ncbi:phosphotransferase family protein [Hoyosella rhizosphaerae]|nr:phosphotransferase family protein [Hoyosella rhizosphaerae]
MHEWLQGHVSGLVSIPEVTQFPGGASNLTYLVKYPDREFVLRRPPAGHRAASAHDMGREYEVQKALKPHFHYVPQMVALCADTDVIGTEFYVMQRLNGIILRRNLPKGLDLTPAATRKLCLSVLDRLVELHNVDTSSAGLQHLGKGHGYVERQIRGWSDRYRRAHTENVPTFESVMQWLDQHRPDDVRTCLIHNDFRFDNVVFANTGSNSTESLKVIGILDWEMATLGDPLMELGATLAYWVQADDDDVMQQTRRQPTHLPGMLTRNEVVEYYAQATGLNIQNWAFYEVYGLFRLAVIVQQLYRRYCDGNSSNPLYADFWMFVGYLEWRCSSIIDSTT